MIEIDGSYLEGGGQIIRTAVALSTVSGKPCKIFNIRANRPSPGLQAQHKTAVNSVAKLCNAKLKGVGIGSNSIEFYPEEIYGGSLVFDIGTAGSISLVLQSLMIPAVHCKNPLDIKIKGGTMVRWSPTIGYLQNITLPLLRKFGYNAEITLIRHGFYPKGGGVVEAKINKSNNKPIEFLNRGKLIKIIGMCIASRYLEKANVAERMQKLLKKEISKIGPNEIEFHYFDTSCPGCGIDLFAEYENTIISSNSICEIRKPAEDVAKEALDLLLAEHNSGAALDKHMADQILPYMALGTINGHESVVKVSEITSHVKTNIWVVEKFLPVKFKIDKKNKIISCVKI